MRVIVLLLAALMMTGAVGQVACASPDAVTAVDGPCSVDTPVVVESAVVLVPDLHAPIRVEAPTVPAHGRMHAVQVFRPPRLIASR